MTQTIKASFDDYYSADSPQAYTLKLVRDTKYHLPFHAAELLRNYFQDAKTPLKATFLGSGYGLEVAALKYNYGPEDIVKWWGGDNPRAHSFEGGDDRFLVTMVDIHEPPLQFAKEVGLCDRYYVCDLLEDWSQEFTEMITHDTDLLLGIGVTGYLRVERFRDILKLMENSQIQFFCFAVTNLNRDTFVRLFDDSALDLHNLGRSRQRDYADDTERQKVLDFLNRRGICTPEDEAGFMTSLYMVTQPQASRNFTNS